MCLYCLAVWYFLWLFIQFIQGFMMNKPLVLTQSETPSPPGPQHLQTAAFKISSVYSGYQARSLLLLTPSEICCLGLELLITGSQPGYRLTGIAMCINDSFSDKQFLIASNLKLFVSNPVNPCTVRYVWLKIDWVTLSIYLVSWTVVYKRHSVT